MICTTKEAEKKKKETLEGTGTVRRISIQTYFRVVAADWVRDKGIISVKEVYAIG